MSGIKIPLGAARGLVRITVARGLVTMVVGASMLAASASPARGQLDANDPWPKFGRDVGNTCFADVRGPQGPELRWWAPLGTPGSPHQGGAAIARISDIDYAIVGTPSAILLPDEPQGTTPKPRIFIFRIGDAAHVPTAPASYARVITLGGADDLVSSTPLVLANRRMVVQTKARLRCYDLSGLPNGDLPLIWTSPSLPSNYASVGCGIPNRNDPNQIRVYALGALPIGDPPVNYVHITSIDPNQNNSTAPLIMNRALRPVGNPANPTQHISQCPAVGPIHPDDDRYGSGANLVYCSTLESGSDGYDHLFALYADNVSRLPLNDVLVWSTRFDVGPNFKIGTYASPSVYRDGGAFPGKLIIGADDGNLYKLNNRTDQGTGSAVRIWSTTAGVNVSTTAGISPDGDILNWNEGDAVQYWVDEGNTVQEKVGEVAIHNDTDMGAPAADTYRMYVANDLDTGSPNSQSVYGIRYDQGESTFSLAWRYEPPTSVAGHNLRRTFQAPIAIHSDGTLITVNNGYILAIRPLRADFDCNGEITCEDADYFVMALLDPEAWESTYGAPYGANLQMIGDCNDDGVLNNYDIDCVADIICASCTECYGDGFSGSGTDSGNLTAPEVFAYLRDYFGSE